MDTRRRPQTAFTLLTIALVIFLLASLGQANTSASASSSPQNSNPLHDSHNNSCTFTASYWRDRPQSWPLTSLSIGGVTYSQQQLIQILKTSSNNKPTYALAQQLIAARLNVANGAHSSSIDTLIAQTDTFLSSHPLGSTLSKSQRTSALKLAGKLEDFNRDDDDRHCRNRRPTKTPTSTATDTPTNTTAASTSTPTDTPTNTPVTATNTPTDTPTNTPVAPTNTPTDTPTNTPVTPTNTPTDTPTNTPVTATNTPTDTPTNTPVTPTNTPTDTPTSTPVTPTSTPTDTPTSTSSGSTTYVCPPSDTAGFPLGSSDITVNPIFCSYPAFVGENPTDFFCTYNASDGLIAQDHDAGFCPATAVQN